MLSLDISLGSTKFQKSRLLILRTKIKEIQTIMGNTTVYLFHLNKYVTKCHQILINTIEINRLHNQTIKILIYQQIIFFFVIFSSFAIFSLNMLPFFFLFFSLNSTLHFFALWIHKFLRSCFYYRVMASLTLHLKLLQNRLYYSKNVIARPRTVQILQIDITDIN